MTDIQLTISGIPTKIILSREHWFCKGAGCEDCDDGYVTTPEGEAVLQFIRRHLRLSAKVTT